MRLENSLVITKREYLARIRTKGFWIATVALPIFIAAMGVVPSLLMLKQGRTHRVAVVDATGVIGGRLVAALAEPDPIEEMARSLGGDGGAGPERADFALELVAPDRDREAQAAALDAAVLAGDWDAWIRIEEETLDSNTIEYHAESVSNFITQERLERALSTAIREYRLERAGYDAEEVGRLARSVDLEAYKVTETGSEREGVTAGIILAYVLFFLLYMVLVIYGQQVMNGVLEEKSSRIVEVIVSTTRPIELMFGKLLGICLTALTQLGIWLGCMVIVTLPGVVGAMAWIPEEVDVPTLGPVLLGHFFLHFLLGFFLFSTFYAAIGAAFNNVQEAQQFASLAVVFLVAPVLLFWVVINDPDGTMSVVTSLIPLFTPLLMMLRIAVKMPPAWQIVLGYLLTAGFTWLMVWLGARIYRVGILMYGKKPTVPELWRWMRRA